MATLFSWTSLLVLPFWALMIVLPHWRWTQRIMQSPLVIVPVALLYPILVLPHVVTIFPLLLSPHLAGIASLLGSPLGATIGWVHFLTFDLFVGRWSYLESRKLGISAWLMALILFLTLMLGPLGFLLFLLIRTIPLFPHKSSRTSDLQPAQAQTGVQR